MLHKPSANVKKSSQMPQTPGKEGWEHLTHDDFASKMELEEELLAFTNMVYKKGLNMNMLCSDMECQKVMSIVYKRIEKYMGIGKRLCEHNRRLFPNGIIFESWHYDPERIWTQAERNHLLEKTGGAGGDANDQANDDGDDGGAGTADGGDGGADDGGDRGADEGGDRGAGATGGGGAGHA